MILFQMIPDHHHAVRMIRDGEPHWKPLITTDNSAPGAPLDLDNQGQEGDEGKVHPGLRHIRLKDTNSKIKHIQILCFVQTKAMFDEDKGLSLQE